MTSSSSSSSVRIEIDTTSDDDHTVIHMRDAPNKPERFA